MEVINSYNVKLTNVNKSIIDTISIYRKAVAFLIDTYNQEWASLVVLNGKEKNNFAEKLVHQTNNNPNPSYDFDKLFYKFPSYLRRSAISDALGVVSSYQSNLDNYNKDRYEATSNGKKFKKQCPKLSLKHFKCPALYKGNMFLKKDTYTGRIKIYKYNIKNKTSDWIWLSVQYRKTDIDYINKNCLDYKELSPILIRKNSNVYLKFIFKKEVKLNKKKIKDQKVMGVDLGLNHSAVCSIIDLNGTVANRLFINQPVEKDRLDRMLKHLRLKQKQSNKTKMPKVWGKINGLNTQITNNTVSKIVNFAKENGVDVIVFEYLDFKGKKPKNKAMRLNLWAKRAIQSKVEHKAHSFGMRVNRVNAKNTSILAFDGSGKVHRNSKNAKLCTFATGKKYNCDLNASYNIASRYIIREVANNIREKKYTLLVAKVPLIERRTQCTLSTLKELNLYL
ncbi:MAG: IS200/IS605 family accessory protein TnpB-related protein [Peptostreptococcaceae bacterium]